MSSPYDYSNGYSTGVNTLAMPEENSTVNLRKMSYAIENSIFFISLLSVLIYLILREKSQNIKDYGKVLLLTCIFDLINSIFAFAVQMTPILLTNDLAKWDKPSKILIIMPTRFAAWLSAETACRELNLILGEQIGFAHSGRMAFSANTNILYVTTRIAELLLRTPLKNLTHLIFDEIHKRPLGVNICLYNALKKHSVNSLNLIGTKILFMSATIDDDFSEKMQIYVSQFYNVTNPKVNLILLPAPVRKYDIYEIPAERFFRIDFFPRCETDLKNVSGEFDCTLEPTNFLGNDWKMRAVRAVEIIVESGIPGNIVLFVSGLSYINSIKDKMSDLVKKQKLVTFRVHSQLELDEGLNHEGHIRKLIIATDVIETSVTLDRVKFVLDSGYRKNPLPFNHDNFIGLTENLIDRSQRGQRVERTGRVCDGYYIPLFYNSIKEDIDQKSVRKTAHLEDLQMAVIRFLEYDRDATAVRHLFDNIDEDRLARAFDCLQHMGATVGRRADTAVGTFVANFVGFAPEIALLVLVGYALGILDEASTLAAALSTKNPVVNHNRKNLAESPYKIFFDEEFPSDHIALVNAVSHAMDELPQIQQQTPNFKRDFNKQFHRKALNEAINIRQRIRGTLERMNLIGAADDLSSLNYNWLLNRRHRQRALKVAIAVAFGHRFTVKREILRTPSEYCGSEFCEFDDKRPYGIYFAAQVFSDGGRTEFAEILRSIYDSVELD